MGAARQGIGRDDRVRILRHPGLKVADIRPADQHPAIAGGKRAEFRLPAVVDIDRLGRTAGRLQRTGQVDIATAAAVDHD